MAANKNIIVTGGAGYIGSHACKALAAAGYTPVTLDNLSQGHKELVRWGPLEAGDICDEAWLKSMLKNYAPDAVMHFAGLISVGESVREPERYFRTNVGGTRALLSAMRHAGVNSLIFSSSCAVHGEPESLPIREDMPCRPTSPYGSNKLEAEQMIGASGLGAACLRYFNASGADPEGETGECHSPETHLIPLAIEAAMGGQPMQLFGTDYATPDGSAIRDYIHVTDLAEAHVLALKSLSKGIAAFNIGTGKGLSVKEVISAVAKVTGREVPVIYAPRRPGDPPMLYADPSRARAILGFTPRYSDIITIVKTAFAWHQRKR